MDAFVVSGLGGNPLLKGEVTIDGAKNAALPIMAASMIFSAETTLHNVPDIADVGAMSDLLEGLGAFTSRTDDGFSIRTQSATGTVLTPEIAKRMRASVLLLGSVLARNGEVTFPHPGGCVLGSRPIDLFLDGFKTLGCTMREQGETTTVSAANGLSGGTIFFKLMSVTATETFMIAGASAHEPVVLKNCSMEPEVVALGEFLKGAGVRIEGVGTPTITIHPSILDIPEIEATIIPDRIETGSFLILGALLGSDLQIHGTHPADNDSVLHALASMGVEVSIERDTMRVSRPRELRGTSIRTHEHPGFPTDLQAPFAILMTQALGESAILETVFDGRLNYLNDLQTMGADVCVWNPHKATIKGPTPLKARNIDGPDIRAGLAFLLAAAVADGTSTIGNAHLIDRGYAHIEKKLSALGLSIERKSV